MTPADYIDEHAVDLVALLGKLIRVETINPPGNDYDRMTSILVAELIAAGLTARRLTPSRALQRRILSKDQHRFPRYNVLGFLPAPGASKTLHFNAHYDVVPVSGKWRHGDAFSGKLEKGWVYGRGTGDMKGSIASLLLALRALQHCGSVPRLNLEVSFTADEETDSQLGAEWLVKNAPIKPDFAIVMEGGEDGSICCGHNGVVWLEVVVRGRAAHGSTPEMGLNALEKMSALIVALEAHKKELAKRKFSAPDGRTLFPTLNIGGVFSQGPGGKINTVPAEARFSIDRRVLATESVAVAERELRRMLISTARKIPHCNITINKVSENHPCYSPPENELFDAMGRAVGRVRGQPASFTVSTGFNDMHFFSHYLKIPTLGYGPGGQNYHAVDERARLKNLLNTAKIYADLMLQFDGRSKSKSR